MKNFKNSYNLVQKVPNSIEERRKNLDEYRREIQNNLDADAKDFTADLNRVKSEIDAYKENGGSKQYEEYLKKLAEL